MVENDETTSVGHDRTEDVGNDETISIGHDRTETVGNNETITIGVNRTESVGSNEDITIGVNRTEKVGSNETIAIGSNRSVTIGSNKTETIAINKAETIGAAKELTIGAAYQVSVGAAMNETRCLQEHAGRRQPVGGYRRQQERGRGIESNHQRGQGRHAEGRQESWSSMPEIHRYQDRQGDHQHEEGRTISIQGKDITVNGSGEINIKASKNITMKGKKILQN